MVPILVALALAPCQEPNRPTAPPTKVEAGARFFPIPPTDTAGFGRHVSRTMRLLATSTKAKPNTVRILVYGQSISKQEWSDQVIAELRRRYPHAKIEYQNLSIGGFASQVLWRTAPQDVYPFYPDLVLFHVYGGEPEYERIIRGIRENTTAEIVLQTDHPTGPAPDQDGWHERHNDRFLPGLARELGLELAEIRPQWRAYVERNGLTYRDLLSDSVHLNAHGNHVMAQLYLQHLVPTKQAAPTDAVREIPARWEGDTLRVAFTGNRVDVLGAAHGGEAEVRIDGKRPSSFPSMTVHARPLYPKGVDWPWEMWSMVRIGNRAPLVPERWTLTFTDWDAERAVARFTVRGSVTGEDGEGSSDAPFVSKSGRVVIEPDDWWLRLAQNLAKRRNRSMPPLTQSRVVWHSVPLYRDTYEGAMGPTTVAQLLPNGEHVLTLRAKAGQRPRVSGIRVYDPRRTSAATNKPGSR